MITSSDLDEKEELKFSDLELILKILNHYSKKGFIINWKGFRKTKSK